MSTWVQRVLVAICVLLSALYALRTLLPFPWRVSLARRLMGKVPDRFRIWLAGQTACDACGGARPIRRR